MVRSGQRGNTVHQIHYFGAQSNMQKMESLTSNYRYKLTSNMNNNLMLVKITQKHPDCLVIVWRYPSIFNNLTTKKIIHFQLSDFLQWWCRLWVYVQCLAMGFKTHVYMKHDFPQVNMMLKTWKTTFSRDFNNFVTINNLSSLTNQAREIPFSFQTGTLGLDMKTNIVEMLDSLHMDHHETSFRIGNMPRHERTIRHKTSSWNQKGIIKTWSHTLLYDPIKS